MDAIVRPRDLIRNRRYASRRAAGIARVLRFLGNEKAIAKLPYPVFFSQQAATHADRILIRHEDRQITYRAFDEAANRIANFLISEGVGRGDTIALLMENRPEYLLYQLAITKTGGAAALINNSQKGAALIHSINLVDAKAAIVGEERLDAYNAVRGELSTQQAPYIVPDLDTLESEGSAFTDGSNIVSAARNSSSSCPDTVNDIVPEDPAWYIYTSGTTGLPKASVQNHKRVIKSLMTFGNIINPLKPDDVTFSSLPLYHITSLSVCWFAAIHAGAAFALSRKFSASRFWQDVDHYQATSFGYVGELCRYLLSQPESPDDKNNSIRSMCGNGLRPEIWKEFKDRFGIEQINEIYGASEGNLAACNIFNLDCTVGVALGPSALVKVDEEPEEPIRDTNGRLIKVKTGEPGLLLGKISNTLPFDGYTDPAKNESKILRNAFKDGDAWFNTGDMLRNIGCGHLQFCDRTGDTFRWKGENVSTQEVENVCNAYAQINESVAYGVEIPGTNGKAGMVAITLSEGVTALDTNALHHHLSDELPAYAVPVFIRIKSVLEKTETFKYQKTGLKKEAFDPAQVDGPLLICLPGTSNFTELTPDIAAQITNNELRF